jgi:hypothetical protein
MDLKNIKHFVLFDGNGWFHGINLLIITGKTVEGRKNLIVSETGNGSWNDFISSMKHILMTL